MRSILQETCTGNTKNPSGNALKLAQKILATGTGPNTAGMRISANFLLFALSRSNLGNNKVNKTKNTCRAIYRVIDCFSRPFSKRFLRTRMCTGPVDTRHVHRQWRRRTATLRKGRRRSGRPPAPNPSRRNNVQREGSPSLRRAHARVSSPERRRRARRRRACARGG